MEETPKYRLVTRSDFDGLVCAVLLKELDLIDIIKFVHPKDMQDGLIELSDQDITTNLPYVEGVHLAFDHHNSELLRKGRPPNFIIDPDSPSTARVVYEYFGGREKFPADTEEMLLAADKGDTGGFTMEEVLHPRGWELLNFIMDPRTGLGRFRNFRVSNYQLMMDLIDYCIDHSVDEILQLPDIKQRVDLYFEQQEKFKGQIKRVSKIFGNVLVIDLRDEEKIFAGNRFIKYALFPGCNISIQVMWGFKKQNTVLSVGKSIFNKTNPVDIGKLVSAYGGGGHINAGTCQVDNEKADDVLHELITKVRKRT
jgi:nanoRNase/pAp phosphatase (c-di-AMP/oligoRNAs hydrolase)